jgi:transcriptional regulator with XRE-family HTH domain
MSRQSTHLLAGVNTRRKMQGITAAAAAEACGISINAYYRLERGDRNVLLAKAYSIASLLGCTLEQLRHEPSLDEQLDALRAAKEAEQSTTDPHPAAEGGEIGCVVSPQPATQAPPQRAWHQPVTTIDPEIAALAAQLERGYDEEDSDEQ